MHNIHLLYIFIITPNHRSIDRSFFLSFKDCTHLSKLLANKTNFQYSFNFFLEKKFISFANRLIFILTYLKFFVIDVIPI